MGLRTGMKSSIRTLTSVRLPGVPSDMAFDSEFSTIGQLILDIDAQVTPVNQRMSALLDKLISKGVQLLNPTKRVDRFARLEDLRLIDKLLIEHNFVYPHKGLTHLLCDGLGEVYFEERELLQLANSRHNERRREHILTHPGRPFHVADCDATSIIYLSILEACQLPAKLIQAPGHTLIRCANEDGSNLNWETADGVEISDSQCLSHWRIPQSLIDKGIYMTSLSERQVLGYSNYLVGAVWFQQKQFNYAIDHYKAATILFEHSPMPWNDLGWTYAIADDDSIRSGVDAIHYSTKSVEIERNSCYLHTLACAYAEFGAFYKAIEFAEEAYSIDPSPEIKRTLDGFNVGKTWRESNTESHPGLL